MIEIKKAHELDIVELTEDLPEYGVSRGAQGTVVEVFDKPEEAYMIEFLEDSGASSKIANWVKPEQIKNIDAIAKDFYAEGIKALYKGDFVEALRSLRKAVCLIPSYIQRVHNSFTQSLRQNGDWEWFILGMQLIRLIDPNYEIARENLAIAYLNFGVQEAKKGKYEESLGILYAALAVEASQDIINLIKQNLSVSYIELGTKAFRDGNMEKVLTLFGTAHHIASNNITRLNLGKAHFYFANFCSSIGDLEKAINSYQRAEDAGLFLPEVLNNHACALAVNKEFKDAIMLLETAQTLAPEDETIKSNLARIYEISQSTTLAIPTAQSLITEDIEMDFLTPPMSTVSLHVAI